MQLDHHDIRLLEKFAGPGFLFTLSGAQESRAFDLWRAGLLERREQVFSVSRGGTRVSIRWAYRRSKAPLPKETP